MTYARPASDIITFAVPKGRIGDEVVPILEQAGITPEADYFDSKSRKLVFETNNPKLRIIRVRAFDVATFVAFGAADLGVAGKDVIEEFAFPELYAPINLGIGKCRLSLAAPQGMMTADSLNRFSQMRVATKYPHLTKTFLSRRGIQAECIKLNGSMELAPAIGLCPYITDLVSTGSTLRANGLEEVVTILDVTSFLIVNRVAVKTRSAVLDPLIEAFR